MDPTPTSPTPAAPRHLASRVRFGIFDLDPSTGILRRDGRPLRVRPQAVALLERLLATPGVIVTHDELRDAVWGAGVHVEHEQGLYSLVRHLRGVLRDDADNPRFIRTVPRVGYVLIAPVTPVDGDPPPIGDATTRAGRSRRWWPWAAMAIALSLVVGWWAAGRGRPEATRPIRIAIVPLASPADDEVSRRIAIALTQQLISELAALAPTRLEVVAPVDRPDGGDMIHGTLGRQLQLDAVLVGHVSGVGDLAEVGLRLERIGSRTVLWSTGGQVARTEAIGQARSAAVGIASALGIAGPAATQEAMATPPPDARDAYLRSLAYEMRPSIESWFEAIGWLDTALELDPDFVAALDRRARLRLMHPSGALHRDATHLAIADARRALTLQPRLASASAPLARALACSDPEATLDQADLAVAHDPGSARNHLVRAVSLLPDGRRDDADTEIRRAIDLDPRALYTADVVGWIYLGMGRPEAAADHLLRVRDLISRPRTIGFDLALVESLVMSGRTDEAARYAGDFLTSIGRDPGPVPAGDRVAAYWEWMAAWSGDTWKSYPATTVGPQFTIRPLIHLGRLDEALDVIEAVSQAGFCDPTLAYAPIYDPLRTRPSFQALLLQDAH